MFNKLVQYFRGLFGAKDKRSAWDKARETNVQMLKEWNARYGGGKELTLNEVFSTLNGWVFYAPADIGNLSVIRMRKIQEQLTKLMFGISVDYLGELEVQLATAVSKKNNAEIARLGAQLVSRMHTVPAILPIAELGALCVMRHDENPYTYNPKIHAEKVRLLQTDDDAQFFFANTGSALIMSAATALGETGAAKLASWKLTSVEHIPDFLESIVQREAAEKNSPTTATF